MAVERRGGGTPRDNLNRGKDRGFFPKSFSGSCRKVGGSTKTRFLRPGEKMCKEKERRKDLISGVLKVGISLSGAIRGRKRHLPQHGMKGEKKLVGRKD